jgi:alpha-ketoglutarate-dependent taurine dioxygenase
MTVRFEHIKPSVGTIVHVDRASLFDDEVARRCLEQLDERGVLVFPRLGLTDEEQLAFTDKMGARINFTTKNLRSPTTKSDVYAVTLDPKVNNEPEYVLGTFFWHMDGMPVDIAPPKATILSARRLAPKGGQTEFANTGAAYEALPAEEKAEIDNLRVIHTVTAAVREISRAEDLEPKKRGHRKERPLVYTRESGRKSMLIGYTADEVVGMSQPEGRALLVRLMEWAAQPAFSYRHYWQEGDLVAWSNCSALHRVIPYATDSGRTMHRTSVAGTDAMA